MISKVVRPIWQKDGKVPLLIVIPYWEGDFKRVFTLARVISGLQTHHAGELAHVCLASRQDCAPQNDAFIELEKKFNVFHHRCNSPMRGYPAGSNGMFNSMLTFAAFRLVDKYDAVLWMEPDMAPCKPSWIDCLITAWNSKNSNIYAMGHIFSMDGSDHSLHLNGGALWSPITLRIDPEITNCAGAWDWDRRRNILKWSQDTHEIRYAHKATEFQGFSNLRPSVIHGYADDSLCQWMAKMHGFTI